MPAIRKIDIQNDYIQIVQKTKVSTLLFSDIPATEDTETKIETWINNWLSNEVVDCQAVVHVFSVSPLVLTVYTANIGEIIPQDWWV